MHGFLTGVGRSLQYGVAKRLRKTLAVMCVSLMPAVALADQIVIAALGDSLVAGYGLPEEEGFVPQLQSWLRGQGADVRVLNAGVSGDTTAGGLARLDWTLTDDVDAVIVELGANDFLRGLPPEGARANLDAILAGISARGLPVLLAGIPAPPNYGPAYKQDFDAIYPDLASAYGAILVTNFLYGVGSAGDLGQVAALMQADGLHPNKDGVARIVDDIGPRVLELIRMAGASG